MSISSTMRTSVSGMNAQATRLSVVSENVANSDTTGYKRSDVEFSSLVLPQTAGGYNSGSVEAQVRQFVSEQGGLSYTGNATNSKKIDYAIKGNGMLVVGDGSGGNYLTRAGSFTQQPDGTLVNSAGYTLMGYPLGTSGTDYSLNGYNGLKEVNLSAELLNANPTTEGTLTIPLNKAFVTGSKGSFTQTGAFSATTVTAAGTPATDTLSFTVTIDGGSATTVTVTNPGGVAAMQAVDIVAAINGTTGLANVASLDSAGKIVLKSNSALTGTASKVALSITTTPIAAAPPVTAYDQYTGASGTTYNLAGLLSFAATDPGATGVLSVDPANYTSGTPSANSTVGYSLTVYNKSGEAVPLNVYYTKIDDATNTWSMAIYDSRKASTGLATSPFPYTSAPLSKATIQFDSNFKLSNITPAAGTGQIDNKKLVVNLGSIGGGSFTLDIGNTTQYTGDSPPLKAVVDGNPAEVIDSISTSADGTITAKFTSGTTRALYRVPLAVVTSPDELTAVAGNAYSAGVESGTILMGFGGDGPFGKIVAGSLEDSNVDLASELTTMISAQRSYTANSKVFQTGSEILDVLVNLKR